MAHSQECYNRLAEQLRPGISDLIFEKHRKGKSGFGTIKILISMKLQG
jgi:hypothetical protein